MNYRREVGGCSITFNRNLNQLYPFIGNHSLRSRLAVSQKIEQRRPLLRKQELSMEQLKTNSTLIPPTTSDFNPKYNLRILILKFIAIFFNQKTILYFKSIISIFIYLIWGQKEERYGFNLITAGICPPVITRIDLKSRSNRELCNIFAN